MNRYAVFLGFFLTCVLPGYGQKTSLYGGAGFFRIGYANLHQSGRALAAVSSTRLAPLGNDFLCVGGEGYARLNKYVVGGGGYGMARRTMAQNGLRAEPFSGGGLIQAGRIVLDKPRFWLYPSLGAGFSVIGLTQYEQSPTGERLNESTVMLPNFNLHLGIRADWLAFRIDSDDRKRNGGLLLGFRAGYQFSPIATNWSGDTETLSATLPRYATNGYFITVVIGAGGFARL